MISLLLGVGAVAGIAGGTIMVPLALIMFNFITKEATAFSNVMALFLSTTKFLYNFNKNDPKKPGKKLIGSYFLFIYKIKINSCWKIKI